MPLAPQTVDSVASFQEGFEKVILTLLKGLRMLIEVFSATVRSQVFAELWLHLLQLANQKGGTRLREGSETSGDTDNTVLKRTRIKTGSLDMLADRS